LELTESLFMDLSATVRTNLNLATELGIGLAIDDFGIGYSCLSNIKDLPADQLKLDATFIHSLPADPRAYAVIKAIATLARDLGMALVAEGVETIEQQSALESAGVESFQGHLHARPMPEDELLTWLHEREQCR
jgi:EAL domain-containing protein (putative c-di-GMP-specific phosphodiesterase class I)